MDYPLLCRQKLYPSPCRIPRRYSLARHLRKTNLSGMPQPHISLPTDDWATACGASNAIATVRIATVIVPAAIFRIYLLLVLWRSIQLVASSRPLSFTANSSHPLGLVGSTVLQASPGSRRRPGIEQCERLTLALVGDLELVTPETRGGLAVTRCHEGRPVARSPAGKR